jgi:hypothetical protein
MGVNNIALVPINNHNTAVEILDWNFEQINNEQSIYEIKITKKF